MQLICFNFKRQQKSKVKLQGWSFSQKSRVYCCYYTVTQETVFSFNTYCNIAMLTGTDGANILFVISI